MTETKVLRSYSSAEISAILNTRVKPVSVERDFSPRGLSASAIFKQRRDTASSETPDTQDASKSSVTSPSFSQNVFAARRALTVGR